MSSFADLFSFIPQSYIYIAIALLFCFCVHIALRKKLPGKPTLVTRPQGHVELGDLHKDLLGVAPLQLKAPSVVNGGKLNFPVSPIMPHLNVIDGVAPFNPDLSGKEWGETPLLQKENSGGRTASSTSYVEAQSANAIFVPAEQKTPAPKAVPIPTMFPSPMNPNKVSQTERFGETADYPFNGYVPESFTQPIDGEMSKWTQFGPCSPDGMQERTRTCVHDEIGGGKACSNTLETRSC